MPDSDNEHKSDYKHAEEVDFILGFFSIKETWDQYAGMAKLIPIEAIPLMNGVDPPSWEDFTNGVKDLHGDMVRSIKRCLEIAEAEGFKCGTPHQWLAWGRTHNLDRPIIKSDEKLRVPDICMFYLFASAVSKTQESSNPTVSIEENKKSDLSEDKENNKRKVSENINPETKISLLFPLVGHETLEAMFPSKGKWKEWTKRAERNGLVVARQGRALFNPYLAAEWWITQQNPIGWHSEKCLKVLARNYPTQTQDYHHLLFPNTE